MKARVHLFKLFFGVIFLIQLCPVSQGQVGDTTIIIDTLTQYFDRSADRVYHVANFSNNPIYRRYFFGTNENYTDVAQHFDWPQASTDSTEVIKVEILGFRMRVAVNSVRGGADDIAFHYYNSDADFFPVGVPIASGSFGSGGLSGDEFVFLPGNEPIEMSSTDGFLLGFETYHGNQTQDDIFVLSNSYCMVSNGPNDGRAERRTKVKLNNGNWDDLLTNGPMLTQDPGEPQFMLDCDAYVFPYVRVTEVPIGDPTSIGIANKPSFESIIYPNPANAQLVLKIDNPARQYLSITLLDMSGHVVQSQSLGLFTQINKTLDINYLSSGTYYLVVDDGKNKVSQNFIVR